ncbi:hypothetical protein [Streptomyces sp. NPDC018031]|uniref:hypothetical protein n=1 Tax=Streptomyces sp. NPDC018031 TaxID=3365033 RepID=UPI0037AB4DE8
MRSTRTLIAGAVLGAALTVGAPAAAYATDPGSENRYSTTQDAQSSPQSDGQDSTTSDSRHDQHGSWQGKDGHHEWQGKHGDHKQWEGKDKEGGWNGHHKPKGGVHTGGGGMALDSGSGLAAGAVLLVGGLGAGAYVLRRRTPAGKAV